MCVFGKLRRRTFEEYQDAKDQRNEWRAERYAGKRITTDELRNKDTDPLIRRNITILRMPWNTGPLSNTPSIQQIKNG